jgi:hypothetical protein
MSTNPKPTKPSPGPARDAAAASPDVVAAPDAGESPAGAAAPDAAQPSPSPAAHGRRFKHRELDLADGGKLILKADGSISLVDAAGAPTQTWDPADPDWASHAIRFGLFPQDATVAPTGRFIDDRRPPRR